eukprot:UN4658
MSSASERLVRVTVSAARATAVAAPASLPYRLLNSVRSLERQRTSSRRRACLGKGYPSGDGHRAPAARISSRVRRQTADYYGCR